MQAEQVDSRRAVEELKELAGLTGGPDGARRVAWTNEWKKARDWLRGKLEEVDGITDIETDEAGNLWATAPGDSEKAVLLGGHIDSVPNGGWLDGCLNTIAALEVMRVLAPQQRPVTLRLVDWADEEGTHFGRSLFGSGAAAGSLKPDDVRNLKDKDSIALPDALREHGVELDRVNEAGKQLENAVAYLELHIEQGPVLERLNLPLGVVLGTFGVERHAVRYTGQHAHSGSTPMDVRRDAFIAAARSAIAFRDDAARRDDVRATTGFVNVSPAIVTAFNGWCEMSLDQRALDADVLADILRVAKENSERVADEENVSVEWERLWRIEPIPFDGDLIELADKAITEVAGKSHRLPSGPLHDAAEMARVMPTVMLFVKSLQGLMEKHGVLPLRISPDTGYRIAVIGAGPAGLSCAVELRRFGHSVTIFERRELGGGLNTHGIVPYRLSKETALEEVELVRKMGVEIRTGIQVGKDISSSNLLDSFNAVFIGSGLGGVKKLDVPGEELSLDGLELIEQVRMGKPFEIGGNVAVIGAGNTAMDCATISRMIGANVTILYRRSKLEMPCYRSEYEFALKHGVRFTFHANPIAIVKGGIRYVDTRSGEEGFLPADTIVRAIGQERSSGLEEVFGLINSEGLIQINPETGATSVPGVFAGGDVVNGGREVVHAAEAGKVAAYGINGFLMGGQYG